MIRIPRVAIRVVLVLLVLLAVLLAVAPRLISRPSIGDWILARALPLDGSITIAEVRLGWLSPVHIENLEIADRQGRRAVAVGTIDGDRPLWRLALHRYAPGNFRLQKVQVDLIIEPEGTNLAGLVAHKKMRGAATLGVEVSDAVLVIHKPGVPAWQLGPFQAGVDLKAGTPPSARELVVRPGRVLDQAVMTAPKSSELLKYALPVLADANVSGQLSLELDGWRIPMDAPEKASGSGRLVIHRLDVEPGPLVRQLGDTLGRPAAISLAQGGAVPFSMADGRIEHRDLKFALRNLTLTSRGSVGVDQTLALVAEVELPRNAASGLPMLDAVRKLSIPIGGTLKRPEVDRAALRESGKDLLRNAFNGLLHRRLEGTR